MPFLSRFVWRHAAADITAWSHDCLTCQQGKITRHVHMKPIHIPVPGHHFSHLHMGLVGPCPSLGGVPTSSPSLTAPSSGLTQYCWPPDLQPTARALFHSGNACFGVPAAITSDSGSQFTSTSQHRAHADHRLPSRGQWHGGLVPPRPQGRHMCKLSWSGLDQPSTLGAAGDPCYAT